MKRSHRRGHMGEMPCTGRGGTGEGGGREGRAAPFGGVPSGGTGERCPAQWKGGEGAHGQIQSGRGVRLAVPYKGGDERGWEEAARCPSGGGDASCPEGGKGACIQPRCPAQVEGEGCMWPRCPAQVEKGRGGEAEMSCIEEKGGDSSCPDEGVGMSAQPGCLAQGGGTL